MPIRTLYLAPSGSFFLVDKKAPRNALQTFSVGESVAMLIIHKFDKPYDEWQHFDVQYLITGDHPDTVNVLASNDCSFAGTLVDALAWIEDTLAHQTNVPGKTITICCKNNFADACTRLVKFNIFNPEVSDLQTESAEPKEASQVAEGEPFVDKSHATASVALSLVLGYVVPEHDIEYIAATLRRLGIL